MDHRGEMLILHEEDRRTDIVWTWNRGNQLYRSSLSPWWYPKERRSAPMTEEEKERVIALFMESPARTSARTSSFATDASSPIQTQTKLSRRAMPKAWTEGRKATEGRGAIDDASTALGMTVSVTGRKCLSK